MDTAIATTEAPRIPATATSWAREQVELVKRTVAKGATDDELALFQHVCERTGLDPFLRQIHAVKRYDSSLRREVLSFQVGIDGLRLQAERTHRYAPSSRDIEYEYDEAGALVSAKAWVKKLTDDGTWHEYPHKVWFAEYAQTTRDGKLTHMWANKGHTMLGKCAEAGGIRKGFPAETAGLYIAEEMAHGPRGAGGAFASPQRKSEADTPKARLAQLARELSEAGTDPAALCEQATGKRTSADLTDEEVLTVVGVFEAELRGDGEPEPGTDEDADT